MGAKTRFQGLGITAFYDHGYQNNAPDTPAAPVVRQAAVVHFTTPNNGALIAAEYDTGTNAFSTGNMFSGAEPADILGLATTTYAGYSNLAKAILASTTTKQKGWDLFGRAKIPGSKVDLFGMFENFQPNTDVANRPARLRPPGARIGLPCEPALAHGGQQPERDVHAQPVHVSRGFDRRVQLVSRGGQPGRHRERRIERYPRDLRQLRVHFLRQEPMMKKTMAAIVTAAVVGGAALAAQTVQINGAGATFPYPIYSKWFSEYNKLHPNVQINYQSIGSGGGIRQVTQPDGVLRRDRRPDDRRAAAGGARARSCTSRRCSAPSCRSTTFPSVQRRAEVHRPGARRHLPRQDHQVERPGDREAEPRRQRCPATDITVVHRSDGSGTTYIWVDYLSKVSPEWKTQGRRRHVGELAGRRRRQGQRGRRRAW